MPSAINQLMVEEMKKSLESVSSFALAEFGKVSVQELEMFRTTIQKKNARCRVMKNRLFKIALEETGHALPEASYKGSSLAVMSEGALTDFAKDLVDFVKRNQDVRIKCGVVDKNSLSAEDVTAIAELPSREVMLAIMLGTMQAPITNFVGALSGVLRNLVGVLKAVGEKKEKM